MYEVVSMKKQSLIINIRMQGEKEFLYKDAFRLARSVMGRKYKRMKHFVIGNTNYPCKLSK